MNVNGRLDRIDKQLAIHIEETANEMKVMETGERMFNPSLELQHEALAAIWQTMPERYQQLVEADAGRLAALNLSIADWDRGDHYSALPSWRTGKPHPMPLTQRVAELALLHVFQCPRPLAIPEAFCIVLTDLEPDQWLDFSEHCVDCLLEHPYISYYENRRIEWRQLFYQCVLCGGVVKWLGVAHYSRPCHLSKGSPYRLAAAAYWPEESEQ